MDDAAGHGQSRGDWIRGGVPYYSCICSAALTRAEVEVGTGDLARDISDVFRGRPFVADLWDLYRVKTSYRIECSCTGTEPGHPVLKGEIRSRRLEEGVGGM